MTTTPTGERKASPRHKYVILEQTDSTAKNFRVATTQMGRDPGDARQQAFKKLRKERQQNESAPQGVQALVAVLESGFQPEEFDVVVEERVVPKAKKS